MPPFNTVSYAHASEAVVYSESSFAPAGDAEHDLLSNVQALIGTDFDDAFYVTRSLVVEAGAGADMIINEFPGSGSPIASYAHSPAAVTIDLYLQTGTGGDAEGDFVADITRLIGSTYADTLIGAVGASVMQGNGGLDTITGRGGDDTIVVTGRWASVDGGGGTDRLVIRSDGGAKVVAAAGSVAGIERTSVEGGADVDLSALTATVGPIRIVREAATVTGTQAADTIIGGARDDMLAGGGGADTVFGGAGRIRSRTARRAISARPPCRSCGDRHGGTGRLSRRSRRPR